MRFYSLTKEDHTDASVLKTQFDQGHRIGAVCVGERYIFVKKRLKTYFIAYTDAGRIFRRVRTVTANVCCEQGEMRFDYLIVSRDERELIEVQLPGEKAARMLMNELKSVCPDCNFRAPERPAEEAVQAAL